MTAFSTVHICVAVLYKTNIGLFLFYFSVGFLAMYCQAAEFGAQALHGASTDSEEKDVTRENEKADFAAPSPANATV